ncbi:HEAT repeat domain-containing protein [Anabaena catenula]|uniref:HEAT repeat domain-containing protein n=1 Tax=Anabaena catenula FACHB-362 TaxID=2692877 RepID=A0ABR8J424_9NOST|nr:HEAT repeat domain-containing protein [Anabaena catenula]MBD2693111.1 HEAT repeat domain-containing protein [Anabaena catenula FACHB-362]
MHNQSLIELKVKLGKLAQAVLDRKASRFRLNEYLGISDDENSLLKLALNLGWLNQVGRDTEKRTIYAFANAYLAENLAAIAIDNWDFFLPRSHKNKPIENKRYRIFEPEWKQTILLWFERKDIPKEEKEAFIQALIDFEDGCVKYFGKGFYGYQAYFLAAGAIAKFKECDQADKIVKQIVKWEVNNCRFSSIQEQAIATLQETDRKKAISILVQLVDKSDTLTQRSQAAESLWKIDPENEKAEVGFRYSVLGGYGSGFLVDDNDLLDDNTINQSAKSRQKITSGDETEIFALVQILSESKSEDALVSAIRRLGEIATGNETAIAALVKFIDISESELILRRTAENLEKIDPGNEKVISALVQLLNTAQHKLGRRQAAESLGKIGSTGNEKAIATLVQFLSESQDEYIRQHMADSLGMIDGNGKEKAITALVQLLDKTQNEDIRKYIVNSLGLIGIDNEKVIATLEQLLDISQDENTRLQIAYSLYRIAPGNEKVIPTLEQFLDTSQDKDKRFQAAYNLGKINPGNAKAISTLEQFLDISPDEDKRLQAAYRLEQIDPSNKKNISNLVKIFCESENDHTMQGAGSLLKKIDIDHGNKDLSILLQALNDTTKLDYLRYDLIWKCAQKMSYPDFYQAWHQS